MNQFKTNHKTLYWALPLALFSSSFSYAGEAYKQGIEHFKGGDYQNAIAQFQIALAEGKSNPALQYNFAVSYYKLGQYRAAEEHFLKISDDPKLGALASYNLGLVSYQLNNEQLAANWFQSSYEQSDDAAFKRLISKQLKKLEQETPEPSPWSGYFSASLGYEDNVTRINEDISAASSESDRYWDVYGNLNYQYKGDRKQGTQIKIGAGVTRYNQLNQYDQGLANIGLYQYDQLNDWRLRYGIHYHYDEVDGKGFQERVNLSARASHKLSAKQRIRLQYDLSILDELDQAYTYLDGTRHRFKAEHALQNRDVRFRLRYTLEINDRNNYSSGTTFSAYSPTRHTVLASVKSSVTETWDARIDLEYRHSNYHRINRVNGTLAPEGVREDERSRVSLYGIYEYSRHVDLEVRYRYTDNDSNFDDKSYNTNLITLSVSSFF